MMSGVHYMSQHKYIVTKLSNNKFHVGRLRVDEANYEVLCLCQTQKIAERIMEALARHERGTIWLQ